MRGARGVAEEKIIKSRRNTVKLKYRTETEKQAVLMEQNKREVKMNRL